MAHIHTLLFQSNINPQVRLKFTFSLHIFFSVFCYEQHIERYMLYKLFINSNWVIKLEQITYFCNIQLVQEFQFFSKNENGTWRQTMFCMLSGGINLYSTVRLLFYFIGTYHCYTGASMTLTLFCTPAYFNKRNVTFIKLGTNDVSMAMMYPHLLSTVSNVE